MSQLVKTLLLIFGTVIVAACGINKTSEPTVMPTTVLMSVLPSPVATVPSMMPTQAPSSTETPVPIPTHAVVQARPKCEHDGTFLKCTDDILSLELKYPSSWGYIGSYLANGSCGGYAYRYDFDNRSEAPTAGGQSLDYCEPRGGDLTSFRGFKISDKTGVHVTDGCSQFPTASTCYHEQDNVVVVTLLPSAESICRPGPDTIFTPVTVVAIDLPLDRKVQGLIFVESFLSTKARDNLFESLGGLSIDDKKCNDTTSKQLFDQAVQELSQAIETGNTDEETDYKIRLIQEFAQSINLRKP